MSEPTASSVEAALEAWRIANNAPKRESPWRAPFKVVACSIAIMCATALLISFAFLAAFVALTNGASW